MAGPSRIPGIEYAAAPRAQQYAAGLVWPPKLVVIHDTGNPTSYRTGEAKYAATRTDPQSNWTSAHAYIDEGGALGSLLLTKQAWAAYGYANRNGFHLELSLTGDKSKTRANAAVITRWLCQAAGIPVRKLTPAQVAAGWSGICGHYDITVGLKVGDHTDPGASFPWTQFIEQVGGATAEEDEMLTTDQDQRLKNIEQWLVAFFAGQVTGTWPHSNGVVPKMVPNAVLQAIAGKVDLDPAELDAIEARSRKATAAALADERSKLVAAIVEALPDTGSGSGGVLTKDDVMVAVKAVLLHGVAPDPAELAARPDVEPTGTHASNA